MSTLSEHLRHEVDPGRHVQLILRSGHVLDGQLEEVDLVASVVRLGGWKVHIPEVAAVRVNEAEGA